jgi:hypothetical protein
LRTVGLCPDSFKLRLTHIGPANKIYLSDQIYYWYDRFNEPQKDFIVDITN